MNFTKALLIFFAAAAVLGFFYFLTLLGPGQKAEYDYIYVDPERESAEILKESEQLESEFERAALAGKPTESDLEKLRKAIVLQEVYVDKATSLDRSPTERLLKLQKRMDNLAAEPLSTLIADLGKRAKEAETTEDFQTAIDLYRQCYDLQSRINTDYPNSKYRDILLSANFDREIKMLQTRPIYLKSVEAENTARAALEKGDWQTAQVQFGRAIEILTQMNSDHPTSVYTDFARLQKLEIELDSLKSAALKSKIDELLQKAKSAEDSGEHMLASEAYGDAAEQQKTLNRLFRKSENSSEEKVLEYERKKSDSYSRKFGREILEQNKELNESLYAGNISKADEISTNLLRKTEQFLADFPRSRLIDNDIVLKLRYINFMMPSIDKIRKDVLGNLQKIDGFNDEEMLKTEIPQALFNMIMQENPSRYSDDANRPVDSLTYEEAQRFCNRLGWILGRKVQLPTKEQFAAALGSLRYADLNEISWNGLNSGGKTHPVATKKPNDKGFYDLLGNVGEFILTEDGNAAGSASVIGGGAQTSTDSILDLAEFAMDKKQRNRMVGFRVVISKSMAD